MKSDAQLQFVIRYDNLQIKLHIESKSAVLAADVKDPENECGGTFDVSVMMLKNMFDEVRIRSVHGILTMDVNADL